MLQSEWWEGHLSRHWQSEIESPGIKPTSPPADSNASEHFAEIQLETLQIRDWNRRLKERFEIIKKWKMEREMKMN